MSKNIKQIYVALELCENAIKILVSEYFNSRFNIIRAETFATEAISDFRINNNEELVADIKKAVQTCSDKLGADIEQAILVLPAYNFKRFSLRSKASCENNIVKKEDVARAFSNALKATVDDDVLIVNQFASKYTVNDISSRRIPEKQIGDKVLVDLDLLCADKAMCFDYVTAVEQAGIKVLDIVLNNYAVAKEASLFEESINRNIILLDVHNTCTYLSLLSKGKIISTEILFEGLNALYNKVYRQYNIPYDDIVKLVKYTTNYKTDYPSDVVYALNETNNTKTITADMLNAAVFTALDEYTNHLIAMCKPILEAQADIWITSKGQQMKALIEMIKDKTQANIREYNPDTIGIRNADYNALYGSFLIYREKVYLNDLDVSCIDLLKYDALIDQKEFDQEGETITTKIKNLFKQYIDRG